jgi:hypothetical protein
MDPSKRVPNLFDVTLMVCGPQWMLEAPLLMRFREPLPAKLVQPQLNSTSMRKISTAQRNVSDDGSLISMPRRTLKHLRGRRTNVNGHSAALPELHQPHAASVEQPA